MIGIIGGSGFYKLVQGLKEIKVETPYGPPSEKIAVGKMAGRQIAFLPRHNRTHDIPPHKINYRANLWALSSLGVDHILAVTAAGSLQAKYQPADFLVIDQFVDRTWGRPDSFYDGPRVTHISAAYAYCPALNQLIYQTGRSLNIRIFPKATVVVINGPRFSSMAESQWYTKMGWDLINMTQYPEVILAKELKMGYSALAVVTDYDAGLVAQGQVKPVSAATVLKKFQESMPKAKKLVLTLIKHWPKKLKCDCHLALAGARLS